MENQEETKQIKRGKKYPDDLKVGQTISKRLTEEEHRQLTQMWEKHQFPTLQAALGYCISHASKNQGFW